MNTQFEENQKLQDKVAQQEAEIAELKAGLVLVRQTNEEILAKLDSFQTDLTNTLRQLETKIYTCTAGQVLVGYKMVQPDGFCPLFMNAARSDSEEVTEELFQNIKTFQDRKFDSRTRVYLEQLLYLRPSIFDLFVTQFYEHVVIYKNKTLYEGTGNVSVEPPQDIINRFKEICEPLGTAVVWNNKTY